MSVSKRLFSRKELLRLIFPLMVELALTLLVGMIDSAMVSSVGEAAVSGVSLIDTVFQLLIYIFAAFGTGGAVVAGQYLGAGKKEEARATSGQLVWFSGLASIGIMGCKLYLLELSADDDGLSGELGLKVEYVTDMADDNEAELIPIDDSNYYGLIRLRKELKKYKFAYIHEIIHYIFDVGYGNKVTGCFFRKKKGKTNSHEEQRTNYMTAAYIMPFEQIVNELYKYDHSVPKMDEIVFIHTLQRRYEQSETAVIRRIREVRKLNKSKRMLDLI